MQVIKSDEGVRLEPGYVPIERSVWTDVSYASFVNHPPCVMEGCFGKLIRSQGTIPRVDNQSRVPRRVLSCTICGSSWVRVVVERTTYYFQKDRAE
jgi:hypothetical protein